MDRQSEHSCLAGTRSRNEALAGNWKSIGGAARIVIRASKDGQLIVSGNARWVGGLGPTGERIIHSGDLKGKAVPAGNQLRIGDPETPYTCVATLRLLHDQLVVSDNSLCGGAVYGLMRCTASSADTARTTHHPVRLISGDSGQLQAASCSFRPF
jgi:hypothetical protein